MDYRTIVSFMLLHYSINALPFEGNSHESEADLEDDAHHNIFLDEQQHQKTIDLEKNIEDEDKKIFLDEQQNKETLELDKKAVTHKPKPATYAVTEFVIDVPDDRTKGPIIANYSISKPINIASTPAPTSEDNDKDENNNDRDKNTNNSGKDDKGVDTDENEDGTGKKSYISILHVKAEVDDKTDKTNKDRIESSDFDFGNAPHVSGIKEYLHGIKQGIVNGFNSIVHKHRNNEEVHTHDANTGPFSFFNKIHRKGSDFAQKIHNHIFGDEDHF